MANGKVLILGPLTWVGTTTGPMGHVLLPGESHVWAFEVPFACVYAVSAHPSKQNPVQALTVENLWTAYAREGPPAVNFTVRNPSIHGVFSYRIFIAVFDFA